MLQPRQLESVARRFPPEIGTLRDFFRSAEPQAHAIDSLSAVASQLRQAGAFRRDLSSHLMVFAHAGISPADLLGIVALAAADPSRAAAANEEDAHQVLRFILASTASNGSNATPLVAAAAQAYSRWAWPAAACLLTALLLGAAYARHRAAAAFQRPQGATEVLPAVSQPSSSRDAPPESVAAEPSMMYTPVIPLHNEAPHGGFAAKPPQPRSMPYAPAPAQSKAVPTAQSLQEARTYPVSPADHGSFAGHVQSNTSSLAVETRALSSGVIRGMTPTATPAAVLSQRLDARTLPANDPAIDQASGRAYPRLWRRHPATPDAAESTTLLAANVPPSKPGAYTAPAASAGTVRPVSLGTMAANVVYSPAPAYPAAAATARVQGQVTIQAEVDRDGTVASARVVSGPPLLRDAALDAVLRWRYHPRTVAGKPVTAAATAMVEFELP